MPAVSAKQERFMQAVAHNPKFAKKVGVPQSVGKEFTMKKMSMGGGVAPSKMALLRLLLLAVTVLLPRVKPKVNKSRWRMAVWLR
jgi:hypothetical protein